MYYFELHLNRRVSGSTATRAENVVATSNQIARVALRIFCQTSPDFKGWDVRFRRISKQRYDELCDVFEFTPPTELEPELMTTAAFKSVMEGDYIPTPMSASDIAADIEQSLSTSRANARTMQQLGIHRKASNPLKDAASNALELARIIAAESA